MLGPDGEKEIETSSVVAHVTIDICSAEEVRQAMEVAKETADSLKLPAQMRRCCEDQKKAGREAWRKERR